MNISAFLAAAVFAIWAASGQDHKLSAYAVEHTPVYGSRARAQTASDILQYTSIAVPFLVYAVKHLPLTGEPFGSPYRYNPSRHPYNLTLAEEAMAVAISCALTVSATHELKEHTGRVRPNASNTKSFPSGHTSAAAWGNYSSALMIRGMDLPPQYEYPAYAALTLMTLGTAWGRVEAAKHYPGDVLAGLLLAVAMHDISIVAVRNNEQANNAPSPRLSIQRFDIQITETRSVVSTALLVTVDF